MSCACRSWLAVLLAVAVGLLVSDEVFAYRRHGRRGRGGFGGTAGSAADYGYAAILRAAAAANLQNSKAAINWEQAKRLAIQNRLHWVETYFRMREINHAMRLAEQGPPVTLEQAIRLARMAAPQPLASHELDPATGRIAYPLALEDPRYDDLRQDVDGFFRDRARAHGSVSFAEIQHVETILELFHAELRSHLGDYDAGLYGSGSTFLDRLQAEARRPLR